MALYKISFYVPVAHVAAVKNALFAAGAGKIGHYSHCAWQVLGEGQFMPLAQSHAFIGEKNKLNTLPEYYVEMVCDDEHLQQALVNFKNTHPYEQPAYHIIKLEPL